MHPIRETQLTGSAEQRGFHYGRENKDQIQAFLADGHARLQQTSPNPINFNNIDTSLQNYAAIFAEQIPDLHAELTGLAEGAEISFTQAVLLQVRREIGGYSKFQGSGDCTTFAASDGDTPVLAQTVDLNADLTDHLQLLRVYNQHTDITSLIFSYTGLLGYLGMNSAGLAVGINLVLGGDWDVGIPPYLAIRHILDNAHNPQQAISMLSDMTVASSRAITLCHADETCVVEILNNEIEVMCGQQLVHTNHFLSERFQTHEQMNIIGLMSSQRRYQACQRAIQAMQGHYSSEQIFSEFAAEPIEVTDGGDLRRERTIASIVMYPLRQQMLIRPGLASENQTLEYSVT